MEKTKEIIDLTKEKNKKTVEGAGSEIPTINRINQTNSDKSKKEQETLNKKYDTSRREFEELYTNQQNQIKKEIEKEPLISEKKDIFEMMEEFKQNNIFINKIIDLAQNQEKIHYRRTRKDGSCFYRSFLYRFCELIIENNNLLKKYNIFEKIKEGRELMLKADFDEIVFEDFEDNFKFLLMKIKKKEMTKKELYKHLNKKINFDTYVMYFRFLISAFIRVNKMLFEVYFENEKFLIQFCQREVEPIDSEADQIQIMALFNFFNIPLRIFYIDNSKGNQATCFSLPDINPNTRENILKTSKDYLIQFVYKPGHYDLIY